LTRKDAKAGATKQGRASANSGDDFNNGKRQRIPRAGGTEGKRGLTHGFTKQEGLRIVKKRGKVCIQRRSPNQTSGKLMTKFLLFAVLLFSAPLPGAEVDRSKPLDLKYTAIDGAKVDLATMRGKVVLVDFWATWCPPCREEVPKVVAAYNKYHAQGFDIVGVSLDQSKKAMLAFTKQNGMVWPQYFDGKGWDNNISKRFGITAIPAMWLVNKQGMVVSTNASGTLGKEIKKLLKAP
jgi:thiol-disulfide isomerase/thioredoxin